jgi:N-acyl-D-aspartate/D-glutamate deacylase
MTGGPAAALGFVNRGVLKPGAAADVTVFDPSTISERGTYQSPRQYPAGIEYVIVNGVMVIDAGSHTGALPGRVLRRTASGVV